MKDVGKPFTFRNDEAQFATWAKKLKNYIAAGYGRDARVMMNWAEDRAAHTISDQELQIQDKLSLLSRVEEALYSYLNSFTEVRLSVWLQTRPLGKALRHSGGCVIILTLRPLDVEPSSLTA